MPRGRKEKPLPKRQKPVLDSATYTTAELCARYHCSRRTLRRMSANLGFPYGEKRGREVIYSKVAVHDWERMHMPSLHTQPQMTEDDKAWHRMYLRRQLDKQEMAATPPPPPKRERPARART